MSTSLANSGATPSERDGLRLGISTASLFLKSETENCFEIFRDIGVDVCEVFLSTYSEYTEAFAQAAAKKLCGVRVHSVHALSPQFEPQLFSRHAGVKADGIKMFREVCNAGKALGARYYTFHGSGNSSKSPPQIDLARFSDRVNECCEIAAEYGLTLCYENVHYCYYNRPEFFRNLAERCPTLGTCLDIKHAQFSGIDALEFLDAAGDRLHTVHVTDILPHDGTALPGKGIYDFERLFKTIRCKKLSPTILIEAYEKDFTRLTELQESFEYLKRILNKSDK